ncbi:MAG: T9SS type A sorting domain-containing protein [Bacteroidota bacterium]
MKRLFLLSACLGIFSMAKAVKVTFQVDMNGQTVSANGVHVAGDFQSEAGFTGDWKPDETVLTDANMDGIYDVQVDIPAGRYEYKFINDNGWSGGENIPTYSQVGGGNSNRWFVVGANDLTLPAVLFGGNAPSGKWLFRVAVDCANETVTGDVTTAGNFQIDAGYAANWDNTTCVMWNNSKAIYELFAFLPQTSASYDYKFINSGGWEGISGNRSFTINGDTAIDAVCFGKMTACGGPIVKRDVTFWIDDRNDARLDSVTFKGSYSGWNSFNAYDDGTNGDATAGDHIWTAIYSVAMDTSARYEWGGEGKDLVAGTKGWLLPPGGNRKFQFNLDGTVMGDTMYVMTPKGSKTVNVTFSVDMSNETPSPDGVFIFGDFQAPTQWEEGKVQLNQSGAIFSLTIPVYNGNYFYRFINGKGTSKVEETAIDSSCGTFDGYRNINNRNLFLYGTSNDTILPVYTFNKCQSASTTNGINSLKSIENISIYPNPMNEYTVLNLGNEGRYQVAVMDITGKVIRSYANQTQGYLTIEKGELTSGVYMIRVVNQNNQTSQFRVTVY